jgi:hypothetical protein
VRKHLLSNWINILGTIAGLYSIILILALYRLFAGERGLTMETVIVETIGGSFMYFAGAFLFHFPAFLFYVLSLLFVDALLFRLVLRNKLRTIIVAEIVMFSILFIIYSIIRQSLILLILPLFFVFSQVVRKSKLQGASAR